MQWWVWWGMWVWAGGTLGVGEEGVPWRGLLCGAGCGGRAVSSGRALVEGPAECGCCWRQWRRERQAQVFYSCAPGSCPQRLLAECGPGLPRRLPLLALPPRLLPLPPGRRLRPAGLPPRPRLPGRRPPPRLSLPPPPLRSPPSSPDLFSPLIPQLPPPKAHLSTIPNS